LFDERDDRTADSERTSRRSGPRLPAHVLVCDDEPRLATLVVALLEQSDHRAFAVADLTAAIAAVLERRFDVVLLDVNLRGSGASQVLKELVVHGLVGKVVLTSGCAEEDVSRELLGHPQVAGYLAKPYPVEQLLEAIDAAVGQTAVRRAG
jgi:two-component system, OmpR family, response regulator